MYIAYFVEAATKHTWEALTDIRLLALSMKEKIDTGVEILKKKII